ncbi:AMP-binding protein [Zooshikella harenae]|uniref:AMP-binding protein n=1 Tax=Zooshikella harenae TaxID=2827238 RepID=A0ABS5ZDQ4_9GAMM|nr:AMP-binding protein [Zooshikella harenae]MBU2711958.1 AMP-binding protein [Zooshikella harenae]
MLSKRILQYLKETSDRVFAKEINGTEYTLDQLRNDINLVKKNLAAHNLSLSGKIVGIAMRSSYEWVVTHFATMELGTILLPVPLEFADEQIASLMTKATAVFVADEQQHKRINTILPDKLCINAKGEPLNNNGLGNTVEIPEGLLSIIHTSGTTSKPKGVMIRDEALNILVNSLFKRVPAQPLHYLSIVPMSLLIEQVLGIYLPLLSGGTITFMPKAMTEYGAGIGEPIDYLHLIKQATPNFIYLPPKLLEETNRVLESTDKTTLFGSAIDFDNLHIITGGAKISPEIIQSLDKHNIKVFEAYGLSENSSVISINGPNERKIGSVGKLLDGIVPKFVDGELLVKTPTLCAGYYNADDTACDLSDGYLHTGDIAEIRDGYLYITGRKKHVIILSNSRNLSPEWVESIYKQSLLIDDMIVIGEAQAYPTAIILSKADKETVHIELHKYHDQIAKFAQINHFELINDFDEFRGQYYTVSGKPKRSEIDQSFSTSLYRN